MSTTPVSTLLRHLPYPDSPWVLSEPLQARVAQTPNSTSAFKKCEVLPSDKEWAFVKAAFEQQKPTTYGIKRVYYVYREPIAVAFHHHLSRADELAEAYPPKWPEEAPDEERTRVLDRFHRMVGAGSVHLVPLWHGSTKESYEKICQLGFKILTAFPAILEKLLPKPDQKLKNGWDKGCELLLPLLGSPGQQQPLSPFSLLKDFIEKHPQGSIADFALQTIGSFETKEEIDSCLPLIAGIARANFSDQEHERLYKILSLHPSLESLREHYLQIIPQGDLFNHLATIPNRSGYRQKMRLEQERLIQQIEAITQTTPTPVKVTAPFFKETRYLKQELIKNLDSKGNILRGYKESNHAVCHIEGEGFDLHLKQQPTQPMQEYAVYSLTNRIVGTGVPPSNLVKFDVELPGQPKLSYPVLVSETVVGTNLKEILIANPKHVFSAKLLTHFLLLGLLTRLGREAPEF